MLTPPKNVFHQSVFILITPQAASNTDAFTELSLDGAPVLGFLPGTRCPQCHGISQPASHAHPKSQCSPHRSWQVAVRGRAAPFTSGRSADCYRRDALRSCSPHGLALRPPLRDQSMLPELRLWARALEPGAFLAPGVPPRNPLAPDVRIVTAVLPGANSDTAARREL